VIVSRFVAISASADARASRAAHHAFPILLADVKSDAIVSMILRLQPLSLLSMMPVLLPCCVVVAVLATLGFTDASKHWHCFGR